MSDTTPTPTEQSAMGERAAARLRAVTDGLVVNAPSSPLTSGVRRYPKPH